MNWRIDTMRLFHTLNKHKERITEEQINYSSLFRSMENGQTLYNQLKVRCHPDRFIGTSKIPEAERLFKLVQENNTTYARLLELRDEIEMILYNE